MLTRLHLHQLRNIAEAELLPGPAFNLIHGDNGAGKTSILEAIHYLHVGRSFRSHQNQAVIRSGAESLAVFGQFQLGERACAVGLSRERAGDWIVKIDGEKRDSLSELAGICPQLVLTPDSFQLLTAGPKLRRQFLDWGVFHVEHRFLPAWQRWSRCLKQRNAALKSARRYQDVALWDGEYAALAVQLAELRAAYLGHLLPALRALAGDFLPDQDLRFGFYAGWDRQQDLKELLASHFETDRRQGFTGLGPHKADLRIRLGSLPAQDVLSRGQQKRLVTVLKLAQAKVLREQTGKPCLFLVDDLPSELDDASRAALLGCLRDYRMQVFVSSITREAVAAFIDPTELTVFHVEHGRVIPE